MKYLLLIFVLLFSVGAACPATQGLPTAIGVGDDAISCITDRIRCVQRCDVVRDGKTVAFTETPLKPELCEIQQPLQKSNYKQKSGWSDWIITKIN